MSTFQYSVIELMDRRTLGESKVLSPGTTYLLQLGPITHLDSVNGIYVRLKGTRYDGGGAGDPISLQLQHSLDVNDPNAEWLDVGTAGTFGTAGQGTIAVPVAATNSVFFIPAATAVMLPAVRLKIVCGATAGGTITSFRRTNRGV
jgi:hypothetical protein